MTEQVVINTNEPVDTTKHDQEMIDKFDGKKPDDSTVNQNQSDQKPAERPAWLPEKFESPEAMAAAYKELESKLGGKPEGEPEKKPDGDAEANSDADPNADANADAISFAQTEFETAGKLSDETYARLQAEKGLTREHVDAYIAGIKHQQETNAKAIYDAVGGADTFGKLSAWATANLSGEEIDKINDSLAGKGGDPISAVKELHARFTEATGVKPQLLNGDDSNGPTVPKFESWAQVKSAMSDPRYRTDQAYRTEVEQKLAASNI